MKLYPELVFKINSSVADPKNKKLLIVDDDGLFLESLYMVLSDDYIVDLVQDPLMAIESLKEQNYDAIIVDYNMREIDGIEFIRRVRRSDHRTGIILISGYGTYEIATEAIQLGVTSLLSKPPEFNELKKAIQTAIDEKKLFDQLNKIENLSDETIVSYHVLETQQKEIEKLKELLRWTYRQLEAVFHIVPEPMLIVDPELKIQMLNKAAAGRTKKTPEEWIGRFCYELFGKNNASECTDCPVQQVFSLGLPMHSLFAEAPDQEPSIVHAYPIVDDMQHKIVSVIEVHHPVNNGWRRSGKNMPIMESDQRLNMISEIRHEINNMLSILKTVSEVIGMSIASHQWGRARSTFPLLEENIERMANYLKNLTSKEQASNKNVVVVPQFIEKLIDTLSRQPLYQNISFEKKWAQQDLRIWVNEEHFQEIVLNLVKNAAEAMKAGAITFMADRIKENNEVRLRIADNGPGISQNLLPKLFDERITTKDNGHGYGLMIVKRLIEQNNGTIYVNLQATGGTEFILHFPGTDKPSNWSSIKI